MIRAFTTPLLLSLCGVAFALPQTGATVNNNQTNQYMSVSAILGQDSTSLTGFNYLDSTTSAGATEATISDHNGTFMFGTLFDISFRATPKEERFLGFETGYIISTKDTHTAYITTTSSVDYVTKTTDKVNYNFSYTQIPVLMTYTDVSTNHKFALVAKIGPSIVNFKEELSGPSRYSLSTSSQSAMLLTLGLDAHYHIKPHLDVMVGFMGSPTALLVNGQTSNSDGVRLNGIWSVYGGVSYYL